MRKFVVFLMIVSLLVWGVYYTYLQAPSGVAAGEMAPVFKATTVDGSPFNLEQLRGKVVVLDFWATWCGPCRAMIPHERELVAKFQNQPFAFVGISADQDLEQLKTFLKSEQMSWINICDGAGGPVQQQYQIQYYPSIFVLDATGKIRYRDVRGAELEKAVETLLKEIAG